MSDPLRPKTVVLKIRISEDRLTQIISRRKTGLFGSPLTRPKPGGVDVDSVDVYYEAVMHVQARYRADYFRKAVHRISVPYNVREVVLGDGTFPIQAKSKFAKMLSGKRGKNRVDLELEEHVFVDESGQLYLDCRGKPVKFPYDTRRVESYPARVLKDSNIRRSEVTAEKAAEMIRATLVPGHKGQVRDLHETFEITEISEIYVPVYEARLVGPKGKVAILRIDGVRAKVL